jgi:hypothetical protein
MATLVNDTFQASPVTYAQYFCSGKVSNDGATAAVVTSRGTSFTVARTAVGTVDITFDSAHPIGANWIGIFQGAQATGDGSTIISATMEVGSLSSTGITILTGHGVVLLDRYFHFVVLL